MNLGDVLSRTTLPSNSIISSWPLLHSSFLPPLLVNSTSTMFPDVYGVTQLFLTPITPLLYPYSLSPISHEYRQTNLALHPSVVKYFAAMSNIILDSFSQKPKHVFLTPLFNRGIITALQQFTGRKIALRIDFFTRQRLTTVELGKLIFWRGRLMHFQRLFGRTLFITDSLIAFYLGLKLRDLPMLIKWLQRAFSKINFYRYRSFLYFIRYLFRYIFSNFYADLRVLGIRFRLKGKISVAGNARTRTIEHTIGSLKSTTKDVAILHQLITINTFTGVLGLQIWLCFNTEVGK